MSRAGDDRRLIRSVFRNAATVVLGSGFSKSCLVAAELFLAIALGSAEYGAFSIVFACMLVAASFAQAGFNYGIVQFLSIYAENRDEVARRSIVRVSLAFTLTGATSLAVAGYLSADWLANVVFAKPDLGPLFAVAAVILPFESLNQCMSANFRGLREFRHHVVVLDLTRNVAMLSCVPLALSGRLDLISVFYAMGAGTTAGTLIGFVLLQRKVDFLRRCERDVSVFREILSFSYLLFLWQVLQASAARLVTVIAGAVLPATDVGVLAVAMRFLNLLDFPQTVFNSTTPVEFGRLYHLNDFSQMNRLFQIVAVTLMIVSVGVTLPVILNASLVMSVFGEDYAGFGWVLVPLLIGKLTDVGTGPAGQILVACRKRKSMLALAGGDVALQFLFVVPMMMKFGLAGAVFGNAARMLLFVAARQITVYRLLGVHSVTRMLLSVFVCGAGAYLIGAFLMQLVSGVLKESLVTLLIMLGTAGVVAKLTRKGLSWK